MDTPLTAVPGIPPAVLGRLQERWIHSAEQLIALGAMVDGVRMLARELGIDEAETVRLLAGVRAALPPDVAAKAARPVDTTKYPLGALPPQPKPDRSDR